MVLKQIGVIALRTPEGKFLPSQPIYKEISEGEVNNNSILPQEEKTLADISKIFAAKYKQYADGCKKNN